MTVIDDYLEKVEEPKRAGLERIRSLAKQHVPDAEEVISYAMPTLKYQGKPFLGFLAHKNHIGIYPFSGEVVETLTHELSGLELAKGTIRVPLDRPISEDVLARIIDCRLEIIKRPPKRRRRPTGQRL
jgi:uncharacterized protein YdhG (YjbR/CyaY superfamily)